MSILKNTTQGNFTIVSNEILRDKDLKMFDRGLLITIIGLPDGWNFSALGLATLVPDGKDAIKASLSRLKKLGYLKSYQERSSDGKLGHNVIEICIPKNPETLENTTSQPWAENPSTEKPSTEKPSTEIPSQYNTKELNTKKSKKKKSIYQSNQSKSSDLVSDGMMDDFSHESQIANNISLDKCKAGQTTDFGKQLVTQIYNVICDMVYHPRDTVVIKGVSYPWKEIQQQFLKLKQEDVENVTKKILEVKKKIKNPSAYLVSALYVQVMYGDIEPMVSSQIKNSELKPTLNPKVHDFEERTDNDWDAFELKLLQKGKAL